MHPPPLKMSTLLLTFWIALLYDKCPTGYRSISCTTDGFSCPFWASKSAQQMCVHTNTIVHTCLIIHTITIQTDQTELHIHAQRAD